MDEQTCCERGDAAGFHVLLGLVVSDQKRLKQGCGGWSWCFEVVVLTTQTTTRKEKKKDIGYVFKVFFFLKEGRIQRHITNNQDFFSFFFFFQ